MWLWSFKFNRKTVILVTVYTRTNLNTYPSSELLTACTSAFPLFPLPLLPAEQPLRTLGRLANRLSQLPQS